MDVLWFMSGEDSGGLGFIIEARREEICRMFTITTVIYSILWLGYAYEQESNRKSLCFICYAVMTVLEITELSVFLPGFSISGAYLIIRKRVTLRAFFVSTKAQASNSTIPHRFSS
jgi:hypothetical protein